MTRIIIDTREPEEYQQSHVSGAINLPSQSFMSDDKPQALKDAAPNDEIIVYCRSGMRSNTVSHRLHAFGFTNVKNGINQQHVEKYLKDNA